MAIGYFAICFLYCYFQSQVSVSEKKISNCCYGNYAGASSLNISLYNKGISFPKASARIWPVYLRWHKKIHLIIIDITYVYSMCNGCLGITAGFDKGWHCSIWEKHKMYFLTQFFSCALDKIKKGKWAYDLIHTILGYIKGSVGPEDHGRWLLTWDPTWRSPLGDLTVALQYLKWGLQERWVGNLCQGV